MRHLFDITLAAIVLTLYLFVMVGPLGPFLSERLGSSIMDVEFASSVCLIGLALVRLFSIPARRRRPE